MMMYNNGKRTLILSLTFSIMLILVFILNSLRQDKVSLTASHQHDQHQLHRLRPKANLPKLPIFFLKTHKTGSSAIQNILLRRVDHNNLTIALSNDGGDWSRFCISRPFEESCLCNKDELPVDVITHHMIFNKPAVQATLKKGGKFVSILRDPVSIITSGYSYFDWDKRKDFDTLEKFLNNTAKCHQIDKLGIPYRNLMMYIFGLKPADFDNEEKIKSKLEEIESTFDLIMINDKVHFHQSLILLKDLMNWSTEDIAVLAINQQMTSRPKPNVTEELRQRLVKANHADQMLYDTFLPIFEEKVRAFGAEKMRAEISILVRRTREFQRMCIAGTKPGRWNTMEYVLTQEGKMNPICRDMAATELDLTRTLQSQYNNRNGSKHCPI